MPGCTIQTLTCGGAGVITGARIARSRGQSLIGAAFAERGQVGKRPLVDREGPVVRVRAFAVEAEVISAGVQQDQGTAFFS